MVKKTLFSTFLTVSGVLVVTMPVLAHGGDEGETAASASTFALSNWTLVIISSLIAVLIFGVAHRLNKTAISKWQYGAIFLGAVSGFVHLGLGVAGDTLLLLNGLGYLALTAALSLPLDFLRNLNRLILWLFVGYTGITFIGYFLMHPLGQYGMLGLLTKAIELGLIACLVMRIWEGNPKESDYIDLATNKESQGD